MNENEKVVHNIKEQLTHQAIEMLKLNKDVGYVVFSLDIYNLFCEVYKKAIDSLLINGIDCQIIIAPHTKGYYFTTLMHAHQFVANK